MRQSDFITLYRHLYMPLAMYALRMLGDTDEAEDVVQEAFGNAWKLWRPESGTEAPENTKVYMYRAVRNLALRRISEAPDDNSEEMTGDEIDEEEIDTSERDARLWEALDSLPPRCREIFLRVKRDGWTYAETAYELSLSVKTIEAQMSKAISRLRNLLG